MTQTGTTEVHGNNSSRTDAATDAATTSHNASPTGAPSAISTAISSKIKDLVSGMAEALVDHPDQISVETVAEPTGTLIRLRVAAEDIGKVIGKQGRTARSMRTILSAASMKLHHRFALDILEDATAPRG